MRISSREKNITNRINSISARLTAGLSTTIHAYGQAISTAVWIASIVRKNHPSADQTASVLEIKDEKDSRVSFGMQIVFSEPSAVEEDK